ncbi:SH3 domain-containing protein [candidate division KSB1 bacterium]
MMKSCLFLNEDIMKTCCLVQKRTFFTIAPLLFLIIIISVQVLEAQDQSNWHSMTMRRVNIRQVPALDGTILVTIDPWTKVTILNTGEGWHNVLLGDGTNGWIASDFIIPRNSMQLFIENVSSPPETVLVSPGEGQVLTEQQTEFSQDQEPASGSQYSQNVLGQSFLAANFDAWKLNIIIPLIIGLSLIANIILFVWLRSIRSETDVITDEKVLKNDLNLLRKSNEDLKKQLNFSSEQLGSLEKKIQKQEKDLQLQLELHQKERSEQKNKYYLLVENSKTHETVLKSKDDQITKITQENKTLIKEIENLHTSINKSQDNLQQQAIKLTLTEQRHNESLSQKLSSINELEDKIQALESEKEESERKSGEKEKQLQQDLSRAESEKTVAKSELAELRSTYDSGIKKAAEEMESVLKSELEDALKSEKENFIQDFEEKLKETENQKLSEREDLDITIQGLNKELKTIEETLKQEKEQNSALNQKIELLEKSTIDEQTEISETTVSDTLSEDVERLTLELEKAGSKHDQALSEWNIEKAELLNTIKSLESGIEEKSTQIEQMEEIAVAEKEKLKKPAKKKAPVAVEKKVDQKYDDYAKSFFKVLKQS